MTPPSATANSTSVLRLEGVTKKYGEFTAVDALDFDVSSGQIYGFLGPNGAGKTTTLRMILNILEPTSGTIEVFGNPDALASRERIGYLPEEKGLYKKMKASSIIAYFATLKGMSKHDAKARAYELLERYGLEEFKNARTEALSKGMSQKVQVLAAIAHDPELVILDEPFSGLDPVNQEVMEEIIRDMADRGHTVLFSTHVMQHAERMCDRIMLMSRGKKVFDGTLREAQLTIPRRLFIETDDDVSPLEADPQVVSVRSVADEPGHYEVRLPDHVDPQNVLERCFELGIRLRRFDHSPPSLHEVFVHLVGADAREASYR